MALLVCINGSPRRASRTSILAGCLAEAVMARMSWRVANVRRENIAFADVGLDVLSGLDRSALSPAGERICRTVEVAEVLIVASPVYRASYSGLMKHLVDHNSLRGVIAVRAATGGTPLHGLVLEHQLRPTLGFFAILTAATALYGLEHEAGLDGEIAPALAGRVEAAPDEVAALFDRSCRRFREAA